MEHAELFSWIGFGISAALVATAIVVALILLLVKYKSKRFMTPYRGMVAGVAFAIFVMLVPLYLFYAGDPCVDQESKDAINTVITKTNVMDALVAAFQQTFRLFTFDGDYLDIIDMTKAMSPTLKQHYNVFSAILCVIAPILTAGLIASFFTNLFSYLYYYVGTFWRETHVFSELNERSLAFARNICDRGGEQQGEKKSIKSRLERLFKKPVVVFTDVVDKDDEEGMEIVEAAKELGAVIFRRDPESIRFRNPRFSLRKINFYLISEDEQEKIQHAERIIQRYKTAKNAKLYLFSTNIESKCFLDGYTDDFKEEMELEVIRVNDIRALIYHNLNDPETKIFDKADEVVDPKNEHEKVREISAVIVGFGLYGVEVVKALLWYCQLPGYRIRINVFDERKNLESTFKTLCPEILPGSRIDQDGDMRYTLIFHEQVKFGTEEFETALNKVGNISYVFVCLGSDRENITAAQEIRNQMAYCHQEPHMETVVYNSALKEGITREFAEKSIHIIGDLNTFYSEGTVINSELIKQGRRMHEQWGNKKNFYMNDYYFYSSLASALHRNLRKEIMEHSEVGKVFPFYSAYNQEEKKLFGYFNAKQNDEPRSSKESVTADPDQSPDKEIKELKKFANFLYVKLGMILYGTALDEQERASVLEEWQMAVKKKILEKLKKLLVKEAYAKTEAYLKDNPMDVNAVLSYLLSEQYYKELEQYYKKHKKSLKNVKAQIAGMVPGYEQMIADKDAFVAQNESDLAQRLHDAEKQEDTAQSRAKVLRVFFDEAVLLKVQGVSGCEEKHRKMKEFEYQALKSEQQKEVRAFIGNCLGKEEISEEKMDHYFQQGKRFAEVEHVRWNAYMRTEGFRKTDSTNTRDNKRFKMHFDLVPVDLLTFKDYVKDI